MTEILQALLALGFLIGVYAFLFGSVRGRVGRPPSGIFTRRKSPADVPLSAAALTGLAVGSMLAVTEPAANQVSGLMIGIVVAGFLTPKSVRPQAVWVCGLVAAFVAFWQMGRFALGDDGSQSALVYRVALMLLIFASFCLGALVFDRGPAFKGERGLALFGLVEIVTFLARPTGRDLLYLDEVSHTAYLLIGCGVAGVLGWATSEYVLGIVAMAVATLTLMSDSVAGDARAAWLGLVAGTSAVACACLFQGVAARVRSG